MSVNRNGESFGVGMCFASGVEDEGRNFNPNSSLLVTDGTVSKPSRRFTVPMDLLTHFANDWKREKQALLQLTLSPFLGSVSSVETMQGFMTLDPVSSEFRNYLDGIARRRFEVVCRRDEKNASRYDPFVVQVSAEIELVDDDHLSLHLFLEPRAIIQNIMPIGIDVRTPMPHTFSSSPSQEITGKETTYKLATDGIIEIFTPGPSIAVIVKPSDIPVGGTPLGWMDGGWIDLPLVPEFRLPEPLDCMFPFAKNQNPDPLSRAGVGGSEFYIVEGSSSLSDLSLFKGTQTKQSTSAEPSTSIEMLAPRKEDGDLRKFYVTVCYYAVDHTGNVLFEQLVNSPSQMRRSLTGVSPTAERRHSMIVSHPFGAFASMCQRRRVSLLPSSNVPLRLLHLTMDGDDGIKKSMVSLSFVLRGPPSDRARIPDLNISS